MGHPMAAVPAGARKCDIEHVMLGDSAERDSLGHMTQRSTIARPWDLVRFHIHEVNRDEFLEIWKDSGFSNQSSLWRGALPDGVIEETVTFATEAAFLTAYQQLVRLARAVVPSATVEALYYAAGDETPKYSRNS